MSPNKAQQSNPASVSEKYQIEESFMCGRIIKPFFSIMSTLQRFLMKLGGDFYSGTLEVVVGYAIFFLEKYLGIALRRCIVPSCEQKEKILTRF